MGQIFVERRHTVSISNVISNYGSDIRFGKNNLGTDEIYTSVRFSQNNHFVAQDKSCIKKSKLASVCIQTYWHLSRICEFDPSKNMAASGCGQFPFCTYVRILNIYSFETNLNTLKPVARIEQKHVRNGL